MPTPRKQTLIILAVCVLAVAAVAAYVYGRSGDNGPAKENPSVIAQALNMPIDASAIGTSTDWEKEFYGYASSTGSFRPSSKTASSGPSEQLTATQQFGRDFFKQYLNLEQLNLTQNQNVVSSTMASIIANDYQNLDNGGPKTYTASDITVGSSDSLAALKTYGNALGYLLKTYAPAQDDATILLNGMSGKDPSYLDKLKSNVAGYEAILSGMLSMSVPPRLEGFDLDIINGGSSILFMAKSFENAATDPLQAIEALRDYQTAFIKVNAGIIAVRALLAQAGITYSPSESGYFLNINKGQ